MQFNPHYPYTTVALRHTKMLSHRRVPSEPHDTSACIVTICYTQTCSKNRIFQYCLLSQAHCTCNYKYCTHSTSNIIQFWTEVKFDGNLCLDVGRCSIKGVVKKSYPSALCFMPSCKTAMVIEFRFFNQITKMKKKTYNL